MDEAVKCSNVVEMIHPARFLFDAGSTPKAWNKKMLSDTHFKILDYFPISADVFSNTDIKGGVVISCYNSNAEYGAVGIFTKYRELNTIIKKVIKTTDRTVNDISISSYSYHFTEAMHADFPNARSLQSKGHAYDLKSNIFDRLPMIFHDDLPQDNYEYIEIIGRTGNERKRKFIRRDYINSVSNLDYYKIFIPKASGIGSFGEVLGPSFIANPGTGHTETFFSVGSFIDQKTTENAFNYLKTKFARSLLSILKTTQNMTPSNWKYVPLQDFTENSDIDWSVSIPEIDRQLYKKYGLSQEEIDFIETHVKEMV